MLYTTEHIHNSTPLAAHYTPSLANEKRNFLTFHSVPFEHDTTNASITLYETRRSIDAHQRAPAVLTSCIMVEQLIVAIVCVRLCGAQCSICVCERIWYSSI